MREILLLVGALVALAVLKKLVPFLLMRFIGGTVGRAIGSHALAQQPDTIHLEVADRTAWRDSGEVAPLVAPLLQHGFHESGVFRIRELPGMTLQLLVKSDESLMAAIYEHPQAGYWVDLAARYQDGTSVTFTSSKSSGLKDRPGHPVHNVPGLGTAGLLARAKAAMPKRPLAAVTPFTVPRVFEHAYAEAMEYRKKKGISAREVGNVAAQMRDAA